MVMEKPSAQLVGREFVRQYYTLLNQAPDYLHRYDHHLSVVWLLKCEFVALLLSKDKCTLVVLILQIIHNTDLHISAPHLFKLSSVEQINLCVLVLRFYGKNSSYVHGGLDSNGKPVEAVYGQSVSALHPADNSSQKGYFHRAALHSTPT